MRCFVTVGTTQFDELVQAVLSEESCRALKNLGITEVVAQCGRGSYLPPGFQKKDGSSKELNGLNVILYKYKNQIQSDMENSQLIIGHAGWSFLLINFSSFLFLVYFEFTELSQVTIFPSVTLRCRCLLIFFTLNGKQ